MEAIKWIGSFIAATPVLAVVVGVIAFVGAIAVIGGTVLIVIALVVLVTMAIKESCMPRKR